MKRQKVIIILLIVLILISSCRTSRAVLDRPARPTLETVDEDIPLVAQRNTLALMFYIERLELLVDAYEGMIK